VIGQELSVRQTEELVRRLREPKPSPEAPPLRQADPDLERVEEELRRALGTKVSLAKSRRGGRIVIEYYSDEELGRLYERLTGGPA
jgi:ParB family chromosome partitioning protein